MGERSDYPIIIGLKVNVYKEVNKELYELQEGGYGIVEVNWVRGEV